MGFNSGLKGLKLWLLWLLLLFTSPLPPITARLEMIVALLLENFLALSALCYEPVHTLVSYFFCVSCNTTHISGFPTSVLYSSHALRGVKWPPRFSHTVFINPMIYIAKNASYEALDCVFLYPPMTYAVICCLYIITVYCLLRARDKWHSCLELQDFSAVTQSYRRWTHYCLNFW